MDSLTIIGSNPRFEAPMLEARIRKSWLASNMTIGRIGGDSKLSYPVLELGNKTSVLDELLSGLHDYHDVLQKSHRPGFIVGEGIINRRDGEALIGKIREIAEKYNAYDQEWNGLGFLHTSAGTVGALEVGFVPQKNGSNTNEIIKNIKSGNIKFIWLLNTDDLDVKSLSKAFVVYQGHHGDKGAESADLILPGSPGFTSKPQTPPLGNTPQPKMSANTQLKDPRTNLTRTEQALLSPEEQVIASRT